MVHASTAQEIKSTFPAHYLVFPITLNKFLFSCLIAWYVAAMMLDYSRTSFDAQEEEVSRLKHL
jgi:hypothetical protein